MGQTQSQSAPQDPDPQEETPSPKRARNKLEKYVPLSKSTIPGVKEKVLEPFEYVMNMPSKGIRDKLSECFNKWFEVPKETFELITEIGTILHNASLVIDDIQDGSDLRRGNPAAHITYGVPLSINSANLAYFLALRKLLELNSFEAIELYTDGMEAAHEGQGMEIFWRDNLTVDNILTDFPSLCDYEEIICKKTSTLFIANIKYLQLFSPKKECFPVDFTELGNSIGLYFQIRDDFMNLASDEYANKKGFCEDITEGKLSYPVVCFLNQKNVPDEKKLALFRILMQHSRDDDVKREALEILKESGALEHTRERLEELKMDVFQQVTSFGGNEQFKTVFQSTLNLDSIKPLIQTMI